MELRSESGSNALPVTIIDVSGIQTEDSLYIKYRYKKSEGCFLRFELTTRCLQIVYSNSYPRLQVGRCQGIAG